MDAIANRLVGIGLYSVPEAARLTRISSQNIRRWMFGYSYRRDNVLHDVSPVCAGELPEADDFLGLSFLDMLEIRFVQVFRQYGVSLQLIRLAAQRACELLNSDHPFARKRFSTDGRRIFAEIFQDSEEVRLLDLVRSQYAFHKVLKPSLYAGLEYSDHDEVFRWYPMWPKRQVVVDPRRAFGRPLLDRVGVPTEILAKAVESEGSVERVARWYDVPVGAVRAATEFEQAFAI